MYIHGMLPSAETAAPAVGGNPRTNSGRAANLGVFRGLVTMTATDMGFQSCTAVWLAAVVALYPLCRWFADVKELGKSPILTSL